MGIALRKLSVENLERRNLLAGNVNAFLQDGDLYVNGDAFKNSVSVESAGVGRVQVRAFNDLDGVPTRLNRVANGVRFFEGFTGDVFIRLRGNNDSARLTNLVVPGNVVFDGAQGQDFLYTGNISPQGAFNGLPTGPLHVGGDLRLVSGPADAVDDLDQVEQRDVFVQGSGVINLGAEPDNLRISQSEYLGNLRIAPDLGSVYLSRVMVGVDLIVADLEQEALVRAFQLDVRRNALFDVPGGGAVTSVNVSGTVGGLLSIRLNGSSEIQASADRIAVNSAGLDDFVVLLGSQARRLDVQLGAGNDEIILDQSQMNTLVVRGGAGNDTFNAKRAEAIDAFFYGDAGTDLFRDYRDLPNSFQSLRKFSIERNVTV